MLCAILFCSCSFDACSVCAAQLKALGERPKPARGTVRVERLANGLYYAARHKGRGTPLKYLGVRPNASTTEEFCRMLVTLGGASRITSPKELHWLLVEAMKDLKNLDVIRRGAPARALSARFAFECLQLSGQHA